MTGSCASPVNVVSSADALGLLVDFFRAWCAVAVARAPAAKETAYDSADRFAGAALALRFDDFVSVAGCGDNGMARMGTGADVRGIGTRSSWAR